MKEAFVFFFCCLVCVFSIACFGLVGALFEHLGAWLYGWEPMGCGYFIGLLIGCVLVPAFIASASY